MRHGQQHWIYVLGGPELREAARKWQERKVQQGKAYAVIEGAPPGSELQRLAGVNNDDVLYVFAEGVSAGRLGKFEIGPDELVRHLRAEGLDGGHRSLKIFASRSGDRQDGVCYAEVLYQAAQGEFPRVVVSGYRGQVDPEGFDGHKTAGLAAGETLQGMNREQWLARGARAMENRVQFPPEHQADDAPAEPERQP